MLFISSAHPRTRSARLRTRNAHPDFLFGTSDLTRQGTPHTVHAWKDPVPVPAIKAPLPDIQKLDYSLRSPSAISK